MKKLSVVTTAFVAVLTLAACAVDPDAPADDDELDTVEQALGEAACGTFTSTDPSDGRSLGNLSLCPASHVSPDGAYENGLFDPCKRGYYQEVQNITAATTIRAKLGLGESISWDPSNTSTCANNKFTGTVYATDSDGVTVNIGSLSGQGEARQDGLGNIFCFIATSELTFARVSGTHTFVKARVVGQARYETASSISFRKVYSAIDNSASPCP